MDTKDPYPEKCYLPFIFYPTAMWENPYGPNFTKDHLDLETPCGDYVMYLSIPFCRVRCKGCPYFVDFLSKKDSQGKEEIYLEALIKDMKKWSQCPRWSKSNLKAVYIGGGTGSILKTKSLKRLLYVLCEYFPVTESTEITLEGNARDYDDEKIDFVAQSPINRISLGVQSFNPEVLKVVGSPHAAEESERVIRAFQARGMNNIQIDMMYNMPKHTLDVWREDLKKLKELDIVHLTVYLYRVHDETPQAKFIREGKVPNVADRESPMVKKMAKEFRDLVQDEMGFEMYMHNHYCKPGFRNVYNDYNLEHVADTLGIGAGAYSLIDNYRLGSSKDVTKYVDTINSGEHLVSTISKKMTARNHKERYIMFTFQYFVVHLDRYKQRFGTDAMDDFGDIFRKLEKKKLVEFKDDRIEMTRLGQEWFLNVVLEFVSPEFWGDQNSVDEPNWSMNIVLVDLLAGNRDRWLGKDEKEVIEV